MLADAVERRADGSRCSEEERPRNPVDHHVRIGGERQVVGLAAIPVTVSAMSSSATGLRSRSPPSAPCGAGTAARRSRSRRGCLPSGRGTPPEGTSPAAPRRRLAWSAAASRTRASPPCSRPRPPARRPAPKRDVARERRGHKHEQQQKHRVQHAGDRPPRAGPHIGRGARDRPRDTEPAEQRPRRCSPHPCATSSQFDRCRRPAHLSATTADSRLSIAPSSAKATGVRQDGHHLFDRERRQFRHGQGVGDAAEPGADRLDRQAKSPACHRRHAHRDQHPRPVRPVAGAPQRSRRPSPPSRPPPPG